MSSTTNPRVDVTVTAAPTTRSTLYRAFVKHRDAAVLTIDIACAVANVLATLTLPTSLSPLVNSATMFIIGMMAFALIAGRNGGIAVTSTVDYHAEDGERETSKEEFTVKDTLQSWTVNAGVK